MGADEFLNAKERWCLWLAGATEEDLRGMPIVQKRVEAVRVFRLASTKENTVKRAEIPHLFDQDRQPTSGSYILMPRVSSERRTYVPLGFYSVDVISSDRNFILPNGSLYEFGVLSSLIHNDWMRPVSYTHLTLPTIVRWCRSRWSPYH